MNFPKIIAIAIGIAILLLGYESIYTVNESELAIKFRMGKFERADYKPGVYLMWPLVDSVQKFEKRILTLETAPVSLPLADNENIKAYALVKWRITDVAAYYKAMGGDENNSINKLADVINGSLRTGLDKHTFQEVISDENNGIMKQLAARIGNQIKPYGIELVDMRIDRAQFPEEVLSSVYSRMSAERSRTANDLRSRGAEDSERFRADADHQRVVILAEANRAAEQTRGEGDAQAAHIYASAYGKDEHFYQLYRSLNAYRNVFNKPEDVLVLDPQSEFFKYFRSPAGH